MAEAQLKITDPKQGAMYVDIDADGNVKSTSGSGADIPLHLIFGQDTSLMVYRMQTEDPVTAIEDYFEGHPNPPTVETMSDVVAGQKKAKEDAKKKAEEDAKKKEEELKAARAKADEEAKAKAA
jgi:hypothetical protein